MAATRRTTRSAKKDAGVTPLDPDKRPLQALQAARLASLTGVAERELVGKSVAELQPTLGWQVDPQLWLFRRVCGRVVKRDPVSGTDWPVPGATVHVYDTDWSFFAYFPPDWPYGWLWPFHSRREEIATAVTDQCGNFCVWIPRFDIDWMLRWRRERRCFPEIVVRPTLRDLLEKLRPELEVPVRPRPGPTPDPAPFDFLDIGIGSVTALKRAVGPELTTRVLQAREVGLGERDIDAHLLEAPAFPAPVPPPASPDLEARIDEHLGGLNAKEFPKLAELRANRAITWVGPFLRCFDTFVPEILPVFDTPDITFGVTQDVDNDGVEETIYSEGLFDVRWDTGPIPPVTLHADPVAFATPTCAHPPDFGPCAAPELFVVGHMPLKNATEAGTFPFVDTGSGYAVRPNRPHPSGRSEEVPAAASAAAAPLAGLLEFWGCNQHTSDNKPASHYRIQHRVNANGSWGPWAPIFDSWMNWRVVGKPSVLQYKPMTQLPGGWWEVLDPTEQWVPGEQYLLQWHSPPNGQVQLRLELGKQSGSTVNVIEEAAPVTIQVDKSAPHSEIVSLAWRTGSSGAFTSLPLNCPTIHRNGQDIQIRMGIHVWADHLRSVSVGAGGCGSGNPTLATGFEGLQTGTSPNPAVYWHKTVADNNVLHSVLFDVPGSLPPGAYSVHVTTHSRAFHPGDGHVYHPAQPDTGYNPAPIWTHDWRGIAIVD